MSSNLSTSVEDTVVAELEPTWEMVAKKDGSSQEIERVFLTTRLKAWGIWLVRGTAWTIHGLFGLLSLIVGLAVLASIPLLNLLTLGYLLEVSGRIARTGRFRAGFIGISTAAHLGGIALGTAISCLPLYLTSAWAESAALIDPNSPQTLVMGIVHLGLMAVILLHFTIAVARGGKIRHFLWPFPNPWKVLKGAFQLAGAAVCLDLNKLDQFLEVKLSPFEKWLKAPVRSTWGMYTSARDRFWEGLVSLRLPYYFWLGTRGFVGTMILLALPVGCLIAGLQAPVIGWLGGVMLAVLILYLPFAQVRFAQTGRLRELFRIREVRALYRNAPVLFFLALLVTLSFAIPLYLLKIELVPREIAWLPGLVFVGLMLPARLLTGFAVARAIHVPKKRHWLKRWTCRPLMLTAAAAYVIILFFTRYAAQYGQANYFDQHAFLLPFLHF
ncbi:Hypothetical protein PBC10988_10560 [Planctomycetales bacterium 10988]|nr:Hypothetical protein PBC10988_10560 [Planctomycetales bacterium 10988]